MSAATAVFAALWLSPAAAEEPHDILNVSYDVSRELYADIDKAFVAKYKAETGEDITVNQSHGGSSKQARAVLDGLQADVVTFNQVTDIHVLHDQADLVAVDWQSRFPNNSVPYYSLPAFLVRKLFANVPVFDTGGRAATTTFVEHGIGDVLVTFEAEVQGISSQYGKDKTDLVIPPVSLRADFPVAVVDKVVDERGSRKLAETYLQYLYTPEAQEIIAAHFNRPIDKEVAAKHAKDFANVRLLTVEDVFGGWQAVQKEHLANGGILDQLYVNR